MRLSSFAAYVCRTALPSLAVSLRALLLFRLLTNSYIQHAHNVGGTTSALSEHSNRDFTVILLLNSYLLPQYNHTVPAALTNLMSHRPRFIREKPSGIVAYRYAYAAIVHPQRASDFARLGRTIRRHARRHGAASVPRRPRLPFGGQHLLVSINTKRPQGVWRGR